MAVWFLIVLSYIFPCALQTWDTHTTRGSPRESHTSLSFLGRKLQRAPMFCWVTTSLLGLSAHRTARVDFIIHLRAGESLIRLLARHWPMKKKWEFPPATNSYKQVRRTMTQFRLLSAVNCWLELRMLSQISNIVPNPINSLCSVWQEFYFEQYPAIYMFNLCWI